MKKKCSTCDQKIKWFQSSYKDHSGNWHHSCCLKDSLMADRFANILDKAKEKHNA